MSSTLEFHGLHGWVRNMGEGSGLKASKCRALGSTAFGTGVGAQQPKVVSRLRKKVLQLRDSGPSLFLHGAKSFGLAVVGDFGSKVSRCLITSLQILNIHLIPS